MAARIRRAKGWGAAFRVRLPPGGSQSSIFCNPPPTPPVRDARHYCRGRRERRRETCWRRAGSIMLACRPMSASSSGRCISRRCGRWRRPASSAACCFSCRRGSRQRRLPARASRASALADRRRVPRRRLDGGGSAESHAEAAGGPAAGGTTRRAPGCGDGC
jgi:hypothetical protein